MASNELEAVIQGRVACLEEKECVMCNDHHKGEAKHNNKKISSTSPVVN